MTQHDHEVVERSSGVGAVAVVAIVLLVIVGLLAIFAFGGLDWLSGGGGDTDTAPDDGNGGAMPTLPPPDVPPGDVPPGGRLPRGEFSAG